MDLTRHLSVLVGGTASALYAHHRISFDDDHVVHDLRERFADILATLEGSDGWVTERVRPGRVILGRFDGIETGVLQLRRTRPLEVTDVVAAGHRLDQREGGRGVTTQLVRMLAEPGPYDLDEVDLAAYRELVDPWRDWDHVTEVCAALAVAILDAVTDEERDR